MAGIALVTDANRGIGFEVCRQLGQRGFAVIQLRGTDSERRWPRAGTPIKKTPKNRRIIFTSPAGC